VENFRSFNEATKKESSEQSTPQGEPRLSHEMVHNFKQSDPVFSSRNMLQHTPDG